MTELEPAMPAVEADPQRLHQIISNLLSNAVKFTGPGGRIVVRTASTPAAATLTVADTGIGFDESFAADIFKPFRQADSSTTREHGGLGLGLSIAKHLTDLHHGTLTASSPGRNNGATFTLTLPRSVPAESVRQPA